MYKACTTGKRQGADGFLSGPSAQVPNRLRREEDRRHKKAIGTEKLAPMATVDIEKGRWHKHELAIGTCPPP
jgi:hypothetical protein